MARCPHCGFASDAKGAPCPTDSSWRTASEDDLDRHADDDLLGRVVSERFAIVAIAGEGGVGRVYEAIDEDSGERVAIKVLKVDHVEDETQRARFFREAAVLERIDNEHVVRLYAHGPLVLPHDLGATSKTDGEGRFFIAMEWLGGETLADTLRRIHRLDGPRLLHLMTGVAHALAGAHTQGILHRDLKPNNIALVRTTDNDEAVRVLDFGIARLDASKSHLTQTGMVFGTPAYMSPEQAMGRTGVGPTVDVYAFGVMLFEMLTGARPYDDDQPLVLMMAHVSRPIPTLSVRHGLVVPSDLSQLALDCLQKEPSDRPADGAALVARLKTMRIEDSALGAGIVAGAVVAAAAPGDANATVGDVDTPTLMQRPGRARTDQSTEPPTVLTTTQGTFSDGHSPQHTEAPSTDDTVLTTPTPLRPAPKSSHRRLLTAAAIVLGVLVAAGLGVLVLMESEENGTSDTSNKSGEDVEHTGNTHPDHSTKEAPQNDAAPPPPSNELEALVRKAKENQKAARDTPLPPDADGATATRHATEPNESVAAETRPIRNDGAIEAKATGHSDDDDESGADNHNTPPAAQPPPTNATRKARTRKTRVRKARKKARGRKRKRK